MKLLRSRDEMKALFNERFLFWLLVVVTVGGIAIFHFIDQHGVVVSRKAPVSLGWKAPHGGEKRSTFTVVTHEIDDVCPDQSFSLNMPNEKDKKSWALIFPPEVSAQCQDTAYSVIDHLNLDALEQAQRYNFIVAAGLEVTSKSCPTCSGIYPIDGATLRQQTAEVVFGGPASVSIVDVFGHQHSMPVASFRDLVTVEKSYALAIEAAYEELRQTGSAEYPPAKASIP